MVRAVLHNVQNDLAPDVGKLDVHGAAYAAVVRFPFFDRSIPRYLGVSVVKENRRRQHHLKDQEGQHERKYDRLERALAEPAPDHDKQRRCDKCDQQHAVGDVRGTNRADKDAAWPKLTPRPNFEQVVEEDTGGIPVEAVPQPLEQTGTRIFCRIERDPGVIEAPDVVETVMATVVLAIPQTERMQREKKSDAANHMIEKARGGVALMAGVMPNNKQGDNKHPAEWNEHKCGEGSGH